MQLSAEARMVLMSYVNIDVLPHLVNDQVEGIGVRVRPYGKDYPKDIMLLGYGEDFLDALEEVAQGAATGRWERLDWAARPWAQEAPLDRATLAPPRVGRQPTSAAR